LVFLLDILYNGDNEKAKVQLPANKKNGNTI